MFWPSEIADGKAGHQRLLNFHPAPVHISSGDGQIRLSISHVHLDCPEKMYCFRVASALFWDKSWIFKGG